MRIVINCEMWFAIEIVRIILEITVIPLQESIRNKIYVYHLSSRTAAI